MWRKICNGAKLGPLILLECQECQEVYHPLCHQPPVVDIDVYDPRIVWRCRKCMDTSSVNSVIAFDEKKVKRSRLTNDEGKPKEVSTKMNKLVKLNGNMKNETGIVDQTSSGKFISLLHIFTTAQKFEITFSIVIKYLVRCWFFLLFYLFYIFYSFFF